MLNAVSAPVIRIVDVVVCVLAVAGLCCTEIVGAAGSGRPNIVLIVADDLGYSDLGSFGGHDIDTPNLDDLARRGVRFSNFYASPACSPTRAMLMSGVDPHFSGLGSLAEILAPNQIGKKGYEGYLNFEVSTLPSLLQNSGYHTFMAGKWHLGVEDDQSPFARGFDRSFADLSGGRHFDNGGLTTVSPVALYRETGQLVEPPTSFYSSDLFTKKLIQFIQERDYDGEPFFAYLAFTAPHWPLQAPEPLIKKYRGRYEGGFEKLAYSRMLGLKHAGFAVPENISAVARELSSWDGLPGDERRRQARVMEVYAAMVDSLDQNVGRLLTFLEHEDEYSNTVFIFMSDNGAEGHSPDALPTVRDFIAEQRFDNQVNNIGAASSYVMLGPMWARATTMPFNGYKGYTSEGGIRVPAFVYDATADLEGRITDTVTSALDIMPTILDFAGVDWSPGDTVSGVSYPLEGRSLRPLLANGDSLREDFFDRTLAWEFLDKKAVRKGKWKLSQNPAPFGTGNWQLFDLAEDPAEEVDLAQDLPESRRELQCLWENYRLEKKIIQPSRLTGY